MRDPFVVATADADALDGSATALRAIGVSVLLKPFTVEELGARDKGLRGRRVGYRPASG